MKKEEKRIEDEEKENKPTEKGSIASQGAPKSEAKTESNDPVENKDEKSLDEDAEKPEDEIEAEESSEPIEENITSKSVEDEESSVRQRKPKSDEPSNESDLPEVETIGQTERQTKKDENDAEQTVDLENKKTE